MSTTGDRVWTADHLLCSWQTLAAGALGGAEVQAATANPKSRTQSLVLPLLRCVTLDQSLDISVTVSNLQIRQLLLTAAVRVR